MKVVVAPDGFGGSLTPAEAADAIATGWRRVRPDDDVVTVPMSDGGEGLLDAVRRPADTWVPVEVAGPLGHPCEAGFLVRADGSAIIESALACGLALVPPERRTPMMTTTYGVGQLLDAARTHGARRILVGLGGSATVDGGAGALTGMGFRLRVSDGSGLKVGGEDLGRIASIERGWSASFAGLEVELLVDVSTTLLDAAIQFGPQKGAAEHEVAALTKALQTWADVVESDLVPGRRLREEAGTGAAGGLAYGLAAATAATIVPGARRVDELVGLRDRMSDAAVVVTGEGRLDPTSASGKVVGHVAEVARWTGARALAVVGQLASDPGKLADVGRLDDVEASGQNGPGAEPVAEVAAAAGRLALRVGESRTPP